MDRVNESIERLYARWLFRNDRGGGIWQFLEIAMKDLPVGTAYSIWVGIGAVGATLFSIIWFQVSSGFTKALMRYGIGGTARIVIGVVRLSFLPKGVRGQELPEQLVEQHQAVWVIPNNLSQSRSCGTYESSAGSLIPGPSHIFDPLPSKQTDYVKQGPVWPDDLAIHCTPLWGKPRPWPPAPPQRVMSGNFQISRTGANCHWKRRWTKHRFEGIFAGPG